MSTHPPRPLRNLDATFGWWLDQGGGVDRRCNARIYLDSERGACVGGHRAFRMPTTMGCASGSGYDSWYYMDDFAMAISEAALPQYLDAPAP